MMFIRTLNELLDHIKKVESETMELSKDSQMRITSFIEKHGLTPDDETLEAMQYQDIISQQLSATIEAIESVQQHLNYLDHAMQKDDEIAMGSIQKMHDKLTVALDRAQQKHSGFGGKVHHDDDDDGIEFF
jgi:two-component sensor histidine kinase